MIETLHVSTTYQIKSQAKYLNQIVPLSTAELPALVVSPISNTFHFVLICSSQYPYDKTM